MRDGKPARWVWFDMEMTGLNEESDSIMEVAAVITDSAFDEKASLELVVHQPDEVLASMRSIVANMHAASGLTDRVRASSVTLAEAESRMLDLVTSQMPKGQGLLAGNSIWMDRIFLRRQMPRFEAYLHHRQIDVSSFKVVCRAWYGSRGKTPDRVSHHTALADIHDSIAELKYYRDNCFRL